jgi:hypothetical protein
LVSIGPFWPNATRIARIKTQTVSISKKTRFSFVMLSTTNR